MSQYIGKLGQLVEIECEGSESVSREARYIEHFTVTGRRRVQAMPRQPRSWKLSYDALRGEDEVLLGAFSEGAWGRGPWHWVPVAAQHGNVLTPKQADLLDYRTSNVYFTPAGPLRTPEGGWSPRSLSVTLDSGWVGVFDPSNHVLPVVPGRDITWSLDVDTGQSDAPTLQMQFVDAAENTVGFFAGSGTSGAGVQRVSMTETAPEAAVGVIVGVRVPVTRVARPQLTWTSGPVPYTSGKGCRSAVVDGWSSDLLMVPGGRSGILSKSGFTIMEVS